MSFESYRPSKSFLYALVTVMLTGWLVYKCVPLTQKEQEGLIQANMERERLRLADEFDIITDAERARLPKFNSVQYVMIKRNGRFWLVPRKYEGNIGFNVKWPEDVNTLLNKGWKDNFNGDYIFQFFMYSPQYYSNTKDYWGREIYSNTSCESNPYVGSFRWNGILINKYSLGISVNNGHGKISLETPRLTDAQYLDICLTALKILNEEIKEVYYVN